MIWINIVIFQVYHFHYFIYIGWTNKYLFIHQSSRSHIFEANYLVPATYITFSSPSEAEAEVAHTCRRIRIFKLVKSYRKCLCYRFSQIMHQKCKINKIGNFKFLSPSESVSDRPAFVRAAPGGPIASFYASVQCILHHFMYFLSLPNSTIGDGIFICPLPKIVISMCDTLINGWTKKIALLFSKVSSFWIVQFLLFSIILRSFLQVPWVCVLEPVKILPQEWSWSLVLLKCK